jgi:hypothetical protein
MAASLCVSNERHEMQQLLLDYVPAGCPEMGAVLKRAAVVMLNVDCG